MQLSLKKIANKAYTKEAFWTKSSNWTNCNDFWYKKVLWPLFSVCSWSLLTVDYDLFSSGLARLSGSYPEAFVSDPGCWRGVGRGPGGERDAARLAGVPRRFYEAARENREGEMLPWDEASQRRARVHGSQNSEAEQRVLGVGSGSPGWPGPQAV